MATERHGVVIWDKGNLNFLTEKDGLLDPSVFSLEKDVETGNIWVASMGGINIYHPDKGLFYKITEKEGLGSQLVYGILSSKEYMWVSTTNGISRISTEDFHVNALPPNEGWQGAEFSEGGFYDNERGVLFFAGVDGLNYFHPKKLVIKDELPLIGIVKLDHEVWLKQLKESRLDVKVKQIGFTHNSQNRIQYRLAPIQTGWTDLEDDFRIVESSLITGEYTLILRNSEDDNPATYFSLGFIVPRPFWQSPILWLISGIILVVAFLIWRTRDTKIQNEKLSLKVIERTQVIEHQKLALEKINYDLDLKNKKILDQKASLLSLHNRHKDSDFEIEQFKNYMLGQFKLPLSELKENIHQLNTKSRARKEAVLQQVNEIMTQIRDWDRVSALERSEGYGKSLTILRPLLHNVFQNLKPKLEQYQIILTEKHQLNERWVELDVIGFKLFWQYLLREILKYLDENSSLAVYSSSSEDSIKVELKIFSNLLISNLGEIINYSPYLKAAYSLLKNLGGEISYHSQDELLYVSISIPFDEPSRQIQNNPVAHWKYINLNKELNPDKHHVVLLGKKFESDSLLKIIHNPEFDIIVEEEVHLVIEAIRNAHIDALIIYNERISQTIVELIEAIKSNSKKARHIPVIYIYDSIESGFQDELMDLGIETFIQLPASSRFILKNISTQLQNIERFRRELKTFDLLHENSMDFSSPSEKLVKEGVSIINEQLTNGDFKVESLSEALGVSKIKCYRAFKEVLNTSPSEIMMNLRLEKSQQLLSRKKMNVSEVSFACGFNDPKYFSKMFKKHTGQSPKNFYKPLSSN
jgi:AraC-like DNA-binding protein